MSYIPSEEDMSQYDEPEQADPSFGKKVLDYEGGLGAQVFKSAAKGGYNVAHFLGNLPSDAYESVSGHPLYKDWIKKPNEEAIEGLFPQSESGQTGKHVGESVVDIAKLMTLRGIGSPALRAASRYHPFTKGQMGRQFNQPIDAAEQAGVRAPLSYRQLQELHELLSHPALEQGGRAGRSLTAQGRGALIEGGSQGNIPALHSAQSLMGDLERAIPRAGESYLASTRVRPMKEQLLEHIQQGMRQHGLTEEAENYQNARQAARRHFQTRAALKKAIKPVTWVAALKTALSAAKELS